MLMRQIKNAETYLPGHNPHHFQCGPITSSLLPTNCNSPVNENNDKLTNDKKNGSVAKKCE